MFKHSHLFAATVMTLGIAATTGSAQASIFSKIKHAVSHEVKVVERKAVNTVKTVERVAVKDTKAVGHAVGTAERAVVKTSGKGIKFVGKNYQTAIRVGITTVSEGLSVASKAMDKIPVVNDAAPLAADMSNAVKTKLFQRAAMIGGGIALGNVVTSYGVASVKAVPGAAVGYGMAAHYGKEAGGWVKTAGQNIAASAKTPHK